MFLCDKTLTLINCVRDGRTDSVQYFCHVFRGCGWYAEHASKAERTGAAPADSVRVRIPLEAAPGFVPPGQWAALPTDQRAYHWTLDSSTLLVEGAVESVENTAALDVLRKTGQVCAVRRWHDHRDTEFPHFYVGGE